MNTITSDDILGKTALDPYGEPLGVVVKLHIDNDNKTITGITIDQGFVKPDLFVGLDHIRHFGVDAVLLNTIPYSRLHNLRVLSSKGEYLGTVKNINVENHKLASVTLAKRKGLAKAEELEVKAAQIKEIGQTIILRKKAEERVEEQKVEEKKQGTKNEG